MIKKIKKVFGLFKRTLKKSYSKPKVWSSAIVYTIAGTLLSVLTLFAIRYILDLVSENGFDIRRVLLVIGAYALSMVFCTFLFHRSYANVAGTFTQDRMERLMEVLEKFTTMDLELYENEKFMAEAKNAFNSTSSNTTGYEEVLNRMFKILPNISLVLIFTIMLFALNPWISIAIFVSTFISIYMNSKATKYKHDLRVPLQEEERKYGTYISKSYDFSYAKDIRLFSMGGIFERKLKEYIDSIYRVSKNFFSVDFVYSIVGLVATFVADFVGYFILAKMASEGRIDSAQLLVYISVILFLNTQLLSLIEHVTGMIDSIRYVDTTYQFLDTDYRTSYSDEDVSFDGPVDIEFKNVSYRYPNTDVDVLSDLNFKIKKGETVALVGVNGAGKTTAIKLLTGLIRPTSGHIYINGRDYMDISEKSLFNMFAVVFQETQLPAFKISEILSCKMEDIDYGRIEYALKKVGLWDKVSELKNGADHNMLKVIDPEGAIFSGGENQKMMVARALYREGSNVMIMDEPTAALDALAEQKIYEEIGGIMEDKTGIFISHRLASTRFCDRVMLLDGGNIAQLGTHEELLAREGLYKEMYETQSKYYRGDDNEEN